MRLVGTGYFNNGNTHADSRQAKEKPESIHALLPNIDIYAQGNNKYL
jgi:hypothetical protein